MVPVERVIGPSRPFLTPLPCLLEDAVFKDEAFVEQSTVVDWKTSNAVN